MEVLDGDVRKTITAFREVDNMVENNVKILKEMAEDLKSLPLNETEILAEVERLKEQCRKFVTFKYKANKVVGILDECKSQAFDAEEEVDLESQFNNKRSEENAHFENEEEMSRVIKMDPDYVDFESHLRKLGLIKKKPAKFVEAANANDSGDLVVEGASGILKDPITQQEIVIGVKNKNCSHAYDKSTILAMIKRNKQTKRKFLCPYVGCPNKKPIVEDDLEDMD